MSDLHVVSIWKRLHHNSINNLCFFVGISNLCFRALSRLLIFVVTLVFFSHYVYLSNSHCYSWSTMYTDLFFVFHCNVMISDAIQFLLTQPLELFLFQVFKYRWLMHHMRRCSMHDGFKKGGLDWYLRPSSWAITLVWWHRKLQSKPYSRQSPVIHAPLHW